MTSKETDARIRIDKMLIEAGWKLPAWAKDEEINVKTEIDNKSGEADYVLLSSKENHLCTVEAKKTLLSPLVGKEQARGYAKSLNCRFIILSNGILHYLWDLEQGNPVKIEKFPSQEDLEMKTTFNPPRDEDEDNGINEDYLALTQFPQYKDSPDFKNENKRKEFLKKNNLRFLRHYQLNAIKTLASYGVINKDYLITNKINFIEKEMLNQFTDKNFYFTNRELNIVKIMTSYFNQMPLYGDKGLKSRTNLLEYRYDA